MEAVNDALNISEVDPILATGGKHASCSSNEALISNKTEHVPSVPAHKIRDIVTTLTTQLTTLLVSYIINYNINVVTVTISFIYCYY